MSFDAERLWSLIPEHLRTRDAELANPGGPDARGSWRPGPLRQLIEVLAGQALVLEEDLEQLYDNHFVETAAPWALPYLGDLLGIRGLPAGNLAHTPRAEVGHTVAYRRRKGTAAMLELLARDVTGWPARAVEFFERLAATQNLNHLRLHCRSFAGLRDARALEFMSTAFEPAMRTVEVRRIGPRGGRWNIPNVGLFVWRLRAYRLTRSRLAPVRQGIPPADRGRKFRFQPLGIDAPLFVRPVTEDDVTHLAGPLNVPLPLTRRMLRADLQTPGSAPTLYGEDGSFVIERFVGGAYQRVPPEEILVCDLRGESVWDHQSQVTGSQVGVDPVLGRVVFGDTQPTANPPRAVFHYGFSADLGGGEYGRADSFEAAVPTLRRRVARPPTPADFNSIAVACAGSPPAPPVAGARLLVEVIDSGRYEEAVAGLDAGAGQLEVRAADGRFPTVFWGRALPPFLLAGAAGSTLTLNGLRIAGQPFQTSGALGRLVIRHCTLAMPWTFTSGAPVRRTDVDGALRIETAGTEVTIENSILGGLSAAAGAQVRLRNCLIDAGGPEFAALVDDHETTGPATWRLENCTVIGTVRIGRLDLASNTLFAGASLRVQRRQEGCVRFCWLPAEAIVPRRHRCLSDAEDPGLRPHFTSTRPGDPGYGQLSRVCPDAIRTGADDGSELGVFHDLYQPQREAHLRARLEEYLRFGLEAGVIHAT